MDNRIVSTAVLTLSRQQEEFLARYRTYEAQKAYFESYGLGVTPFFRGGGGSHGVISPGSDLPYDYAVEYIEMNESAGNCYIDLGVLLEKNIYDVFADFELLGFSSGNSPIWFGFYSGVNNYSLDVNRVQSNNNLSQVVINRFVSYDTNTFPVSIGTRYRFEIYHDGRFIVNDITYTSNISTTVANNTENNFLIFYSIYNNSYTYGRIRSLKIYKLGILIYDFIPVVKYSLPCMYDKINGIFSSTVGNGNLIVGPRIQNS